MESGRRGKFPVSEHPKLPPTFTTEQFKTVAKDDIARQCHDEWIRIAREEEAKGISGGPVEFPKIYAMNWLLWRGLAVLILMALLPGCAGDQHNAFLPPKSTSVPVIEEGGAETVELSDKPAFLEPDSVKQKLIRFTPNDSHSTNANQQNQTGLANVAVAKIAENVDASLVKFQTDVRNELSASLKASAELNASMEARIDAKMQAFATAQAQGIAGIGNRLDSVTQTISSGRDTNNTQFTPQMAETITSGYRAVVYALGILGALLVLHEWMSHRRTKARRGVLGLPLDPEILARLKERKR